MADTPRTVLVVTPHPDDAEGASGGTIAQWTDEGYRVVYVVTTNGDKGSRDLEMTSERLSRIREQEQREAAKILGVKELIFLGHPDGFLEDTPAFREELTRIVRKYRPEKVLTCDPYRRYILHRDHRITGMVVLDVVFPSARDHLYHSEHLAEGLLPHKVHQVYLWRSDEPNTFMDISTTFDRKLAALTCHKTQLGHLEQSSFVERYREQAAATGEPHNIPLAEAFHLVQLGF